MIHSLVLRTHQLDLTGRRPAVEDPRGVWVGWRRDRIADHGLVAAGVFGAGELQAWVCSCRVLPHRVAPTLLAEMLRREPGARAARVETPWNGATRGLLEEARALLRDGPAPWVRVVSG